MKRYLSLCNAAGILLALFALCLSSARAQGKITHVDFDLPSLDYDVIYLADFIDITSQKLSKNIPNFSGTIRTGVEGYIVLEAYARIKFKGEADKELAHATTKPFLVKNGVRTLTSSDLASGGVSDIDIKTSTSVFDEIRKDDPLKKRIEDYAARFPTAPVGDYTLQLIAWDSAQTKTIGGTVKIISVRNASPDEVQVNLIDPQPGAIISTTVPTFSWTTPNPKVTLYVYEKLPIHQSPQEAVTGIPYLKLDVDGPQTVQYPQSGEHLRMLEQNKTYVWFVETGVTTNRQTVQRRSEIRLFRIRSTDQRGQAISDMMNSFGGSAAGTFSTLESIGWVPTGSITLDGKPITLDELKAAVAKLASQNIHVSVHVE
jgi:hypothetical protein